MRNIQCLNKKTIYKSKKILFLGYSEDKTSLIEALSNHCTEVWHSDERLSSTDDFDLIISYGYNHIISKSILNESNIPFLNLHISYLPYNKGSYPNFWSFYDNTPSGVTIHLIDEGIDTGNIVYQKYVNFEKNENNFFETYNRLNKEIEKLFISNLEQILNKEFISFPQKNVGTFHFKNELPQTFSGWSSDINDEIKKLHIEKDKYIINKMSLINQIQDVRQNNNVNWMDLLRLAFKNSPNEAKAIIRNINTDDNKISELFKKLGE